MATKKAAKKKPAKKPVRRMRRIRLFNPRSKHKHEYFAITATTVEELQQKINDLEDKPHAGNRRDESRSHLEFIGNLQFLNEQYVREVERFSFVAGGFKVMPRIKSIAALLALTILLTACPQGDLAKRAAGAVGAIPAVVRVLFPNADPQKLALIDVAASAFREFVNNRTASNWQKALNAWNSSARPVLLSFNNSRLNQIVAVTDIILSQVFVPDEAGDGARSSGVVVDFKEAQVKELEKLVKEK